MKNLNFLLLGLLILFGCSKDSTLQDEILQISNENPDRTSILDIHERQVRMIDESTPFTNQNMFTNGTAQTRPIEGTLTVLDVSSSDGGICADSELGPRTVIQSVWGNVSHLGQVTGSSYLCPFPNSLNYFVSLTLNAANGDMITAEGMGTLIPTGTPGTFRIDYPQAIIGGTGRFSGATGQWQASGDNIVLGGPSMPFEVNVVGTITY